MSEAIFPSNGRALSWAWSLVLGLAVFLSLSFLIAFALPYLLLDPEVLGRFEGRQGWILAHVVGGMVALTLGPFQLWLGARRQRLQLHRALGIAYLSSMVLGSIAAFYLAATTEVSWIFGLGLGSLGVAWVVTTSIAYVAIRRRLIPQHQEWMIRSYVVTFAFVTFRLFYGILEVLQIGTPLERLNAASWFCWAVPLLITEAIIQGRKVFGSRTNTGTSTF